MIGGFRWTELDECSSTDVMHTQDDETWFSVEEDAFLNCTGLLQS